MGKLIQLPKTELNIYVCDIAARGIGESTFQMSSLTKFCLYALDMPQVTSQVEGGLFVNAHTKLYYFILFYFHKCGDNETIQQHFYRELEAIKVMTTTNTIFVFFRSLSLNEHSFCFLSQT